jgi:hypothetical protein
MKRPQLLWGAKRPETAAMHRDQRVEHASRLSLCVKFLTSWDILSHNGKKLLEAQKMLWPN